MTMTRQEAFKFAQKLHEGGMTYGQIGPALAKEGYKSARTGEALTQGGVQALLASKGSGNAYAATRRKKRQKAKVQAAGPSLSPKAARGKLDAVSRLLSLKDVPAEDRIAMVQLLLG